MNTRTLSVWYRLIFVCMFVLLLPFNPTPGRAQKESVPVDQEVLDQIAREGTATFWVYLKEKADLSQAKYIQDWGLRGRYVYEQLKKTADVSQADLRSLLGKMGVEHTPFWVINVVYVRAGEEVLNILAGLPNVERITASRTFEIPRPKPGIRRQKIDTVEWNIDRIRAPEVWSTFGVRGEEIVVANIDTGVQFDHPALVEQYRGNLGDGSFDHNYNWYDPSEVCGSPSLEPCDNVGHGTHTMGTMVGDDGDPGVNQIGVAPHAKWIAVKGCEDFSCSDFALLSAGQWILAPTDLNGENPDPDRRPHIVNNSWGGGGGNDWYLETVQAWIASGIFPAFSNGNSGPDCMTSGSPGDYVESYSAGAFDINDNIAEFSSRGPSFFEDETKPNLAAPGVDVRSSVPNNSYEYFSGTSMASPHVAGTVALMWAAAPAIVGDIDATRVILDQTAIDTSDLGCGGDEGDNNVWGEGRLDAFLAVEQSPRGPTGTLQGTVTETGTGIPIQGAKIVLTGPFDRTVITDELGNYSVLLPVGTYEGTVSAFGYFSQTIADIKITENETTNRDFALEKAPTHPVSGYVLDQDGNPISMAVVTILDTPLEPALTDETGFYSFPEVPEGTYDLMAEAGGCFDAQIQSISVDGPIEVNFTLSQRIDGYGYLCSRVTSAYIEAENELPLSGDDEVTQVSLPFPFIFYGQYYDTAYISTNGYLNFLEPNSSFINVSIPDPAPPNAAIYVMWDDLVVDPASSVRTMEIETLQDGPAFVIEWRNIAFLADLNQRVDFEAILYPDGRILTQYRNIAESGLETGSSATVGIENETGTIAFEYAFGGSAISDNLAVLYNLVPGAYVEGYITDANDGLPIANAIIRARQEGALIRDLRTDEAGFYRMRLPVGDFLLRARKKYYEPATAPVTVGEEDEFISQDFALITARVQTEPAFFSTILAEGRRRTFTLTLTNTGSKAARWRIGEFGGLATTLASSFGRTRNPDYDPNSMTTRGLYLTETLSGISPAEAGDVLKSWPPTGLGLAWGVGYTGNVWLSDVFVQINHEFDVEGTPTGRRWSGNFGGEWPADMAYDASRNLMCQVNVGGDNGIYCWNPDTGEVEASISGPFPWTGISQRGLAYRADDDTFYIGGWNEGIIYHIQGLSWEEPGAVIEQCMPPDGNISGLAWNGSAGVLWEATNSETDTIYQLDPGTCSVLSTLAHPNPFFNGAGLEMDEIGNLWMIAQFPNMVYLVDSGVPAESDVPWLNVRPRRGVLEPGESVEVRININTSGLTPAAYQAGLLVRSNSGRSPVLRVPVSLVLSGYRRGVNSGGSLYIDSANERWTRDRKYTTGSWGYIIDRGKVETGRGIAGTREDPLYQVARLNPYAYRFDGLPAGVYQVELRFAEIEGLDIEQRLFDVVIENSMFLPAYDISYDVGTYRAANHTFFVIVSQDGRLDIRLIRRFGYEPPILNALRVTHRPDY